MKAIRRLSLALFAVLFLCAAHTAFSHENHHENHAAHYHGMRVKGQASPFAVKRIRAFSTDSTEIQIDIFFTSPIDPRTVSESPVLINGAPAAKACRFMFNKAGTLLRVVLTEGSCAGCTGTSFDMELPEIKSFDGTPLARRSFEGLACGRVFEYREDETRMAADE